MSVAWKDWLTSNEEDGVVVEACHSLIDEGPRSVELRVLPLIGSSAALAAHYSSVAAIASVSSDCSISGKFRTYLVITFDPKYTIDCLSFHLRVGRKDFTLVSVSEEGSSDASAYACACVRARYRFTCV